MSKFSHKDYIKFSCPICNEIPNPIFNMKDRFNILIYISICPNDGLIFLNPRWTNEQYKKYYADEYDTMKRKHIFKEVKPNRKMYKHGRSIFKCVKKYCRHPKSIIDIGAGNGYTLDFLKDVYKVNTYFIEPSIECQKQLKERGHILTEFNTNIKFDLLTSRHVLEHINDPIQHLKDIRLLMNDDSLLHISFPNAKNMISGWFQNPHIYYFDEETFNLIIQKVGLKMIIYKNDKTELWYLLKKIEQLDNIKDGLNYDEQVKKVMMATKIKKWKIEMI